MLRRLLFSLLGLALLSPVAAHADDLVFTPANGSAALTFSVDASIYTAYSDQNNFQYAGLTSADGLYSIYLLNSDYSNYFFTAGYGLIDAELVDYTTGNVFFLAGPQLFTGDVNAAIQLVGGVYDLAGLANGDPSQIGGTLSINSAATPEPSSLALLGTGILGIAGAVRRRYLLA